MTERDLKRIKELCLDLENKFYIENRESNGPYRYEMVKKDGHCIFLSGNRCTIYKNRPLICRFYPFTMLEAYDYLFDVDRSCQGVGMGRNIDEKYFRELVTEASRTIGKADK